MEVSRRKFATMLGVVALGGVAHAASENKLLKELQQSAEAPAKDSHAPKATHAPAATHDKAPIKSHAPAAHAPKANTPKAAHDAHGAQGAHSAASTPEQIWADLMDGNRRFMSGKPHAREYLRTREELSKGQHPKVIVLGCADSRLSPELIFDKNLGELFVVRTAGNVADPIALGSIEYAAEHLHSSVLVVLGHEKCGAVAAAASGGKMPTANLEAIVSKIAPVTNRMKEFFSGDDLIHLSVHANVVQSANDLLKHSPILQKEVADKKLTIIKAVYRLKSGEVARLG